MSSIEEYQDKLLECGRRIGELESELEKQIAFTKRIVEKETFLRRFDGMGQFAVDLEGLGPRLMAETFMEIVRRARDHEGATNYINFEYETKMNPISGQEENGNVRHWLTVSVFFNESTNPMALLAKRDKEIATLESTLASLPRTADGEVIVPGLRVWRKWDGDDATCYEQGTVTGLYDVVRGFEILVENDGPESPSDLFRRHPETGQTPEEAEA
jgi:hypothetical protein